MKILGFCNKCNLPFWHSIDWGFLQNKNCLKVQIETVNSRDEIMFDNSMSKTNPMKTTENNSRYLRKSIALLVFWVILIGILFLKTLNAQSIPEQPHSKNLHDPNFPTPRTFNAGLITTYAGTTPPPALVGDITYGFSKRLAFGILGGTTGAIALAGIKINAAFVQKNQFAINYRMIIIYYPQRNGKFMFDRRDKEVMPWMLSMAAIDAEIKTGKGIRYSLGVGLLETHCVEGMKKYFWGKSEESKVSPFELFQTLQGSVSLPISNKLTFRPEVIAIMKDGNLIGSGVFHVSPINPYLKFIYTFK
jgi:hypothetical protein